MTTKPLSEQPSGSFSAKPQRYRLDVLSGADQGLSVDLTEGVVVGCDAAATVRLSDPTVSRRHLEIEPLPEGARVRDLGSRNGTFLAGAKLTEVVVGAEAMLSAGQTLLRLSRLEGRGSSELPSTFGRALAKSEAMRRTFALLRQVAKSTSTVLLQGETGTGKEGLAHGVHLASPRAAQPFVVVDCGAIAPELIESELFGHVQGAFTGAVASRDGAFVQAHQGTLFLDEIGELPLTLQPKLLRALEEGSVKRVGEDTPREVDVRIVAATHRDLSAEVEAGRFRSDLFYRLAVVQVRVPPLRERPEDIPLLISHFVAQMGCPDFSLKGPMLDRLVHHDWPGNVRELRNLVERALVSGGVEILKLPLAGRGRQSLEQLSQMPFKDAKDAMVDAFMRDYFEALFETSGRNITEMAKRAGIARTYAHRVVKRLGLKEGP